MITKRVDEYCERVSFHKIGDNKKVIEGSQLKKN